MLEYVSVVVCWRSIVKKLALELQLAYTCALRLLLQVAAPSLRQCLVSGAGVWKHIKFGGHAVPQPAICWGSRAAADCPQLASAAPHHQWFTNHRHYFRQLPYPAATPAALSAKRGTKHMLAAAKSPTIQAQGSGSSCRAPSSSEHRHEEARCVCVWRRIQFQSHTCSLSVWCHKCRSSGESPAC